MEPISALVVVGGALAVLVGRAATRAVRRSRTGARLAVAARSVGRPAEDIPYGLAEDLQQEPEPSVRLQRLLTLVRKYPDHPGTRRALVALREDPDDEVCLQASLALGDDGLAMLHRLAENGATSDACAGRAIAALGDRMPAGKTRILLERALRNGRKETARACIDVLTRPGRVMPEALLLQALQNVEPEVATAAAQTLGRVGTIAAVGPLREHVSARLPSELRAAARQAILEIQARLTGAAPGQLTLAGGEAGALSLAAETGGLSLSEDGPRRQSPAGAEPTMSGESAFPSGRSGRSGLREG
jgi:HEAT repeats